ncbi:MAG TPA: response regulator transcription factor [Acidimicrobiales bacterium]|nr:response regulator transcription factor [Acidimicrobiales bacterium]
MSDRIKVLVADDHAVWRSGMRAELGEAFWVVGEAADAPGAIELARSVQPDVIAADLRMPDGGGLRVAAELSDEFPVVILTVSETHEDLLDAIGAGAVGYLLKSSTVAEIGAGLAAAARGEPVFSASLAALVLGDFARTAKTPDGRPVKVLSAREREVLRLVARGSTYRAVGEELFIAERTVENHVRNILEKLRLNRRDELIRWAAKRGLDE